MRRIRTVPESLKQFDMFAVNTIGDGNCFFHAVSYCFFDCYRTEIVDGKHTSKIDIVKRLRKELAGMLTDKVSGTDITYYEKLSNGNLSTLGKNMSEFSLNNVRKLLDSNQPTGDWVYDYVSMVLKKSIYIIDLLKGDVYAVPDLPSDKYNVIVIGYKHGHYESIGINECGKLVTYFKSSHPLSVALRKRLQSMKK